MDSWLTPVVGVGGSLGGALLIVIGVCLRGRGLRSSCVVAGESITIDIHPVTPKEQVALDAVHIAEITGNAEEKKEDAKV